MEGPKAKGPVALLVGLAAGEPALIDELTGRLALELGEIHLRSTRWVEKGERTGETVTRQWLAFRELLAPVNFVGVKRHALRVEEVYRDARGEPRVRIDVAYLDAQRVVRATATDAPPRIYLGAGIFGELMMIWREGAAPDAPGQPWTRDAERGRELRDFLGQVRGEYLKR